MTLKNALNEEVSMRQFVVIAIVLMISTGCLQRPDGAKEIISDEDLDVLEDADFEVHYGMAPPYLPYAWEMDGLVVERNDFDPAEERRTLTDRIFDFGERDDDDGLSIGIHPTDGSRSRTVDGYMSGADDCFTVYASASGTYGDCNYEGVEAFSGCSHGTAGLDGIDEFQWGLIILETDGACTEIPMERHDVRLIDNPRLAELAD